MVKMLNLDNLTLYLGHFYTKTSFLCLSLCCMPKGPLYYTKFTTQFLNMGLTPPPSVWTMLKKTALFLSDGFPLACIFIIIADLFDKRKVDPSHPSPNTPPGGTFDSFWLRNQRCHWNKSGAPPPNPTLSFWGKKFIFVWNGPIGSRWTQNGPK